jgi:hypothetical protein
MSDMVAAEEICWTSQPLPRPEDDNPVDLFALHKDRLLAYAYGLQGDLKILRETLSAAIEQLNVMTVQIQRQDTRIQTVVRELRGAHRQAADVNARLRATSEAVG